MRDRLEQEVLYIRFEISGERTWVTPQGRCIGLAYADEVRAAFKRNARIIDYDDDSEFTESDFNHLRREETYRLEDYY